MESVTLQSSLRVLRGVGEKKAALFEKLGIHTLADLLGHFPRAYEDWSHTVKLCESVPDTPCCIQATVLSDPQTHYVRQNMTLFRFVASDGQHSMRVTLFNNRYLAARIHRGETYRFFGTVGGPFPQYEMTSPQIEGADAAHIHPLYPLTEGLTSRAVAQAVEQALTAVGVSALSDPLPPTLREQYRLCTAAYAYQSIHFPPNTAAIDTARRRLAFEELLLLQLGLLRLKSRQRAAAGLVVRQNQTARFCQLLPFSLTSAQRRAIDDCLRDMGSGTPMARLIQGDVGSGKTAVAAGVAYSVIAAGGQVAMMAPTEILAEQHARTLSALLEPAGVRVGLLTGHQTPAQKRAVYEALAAGDTDLIVGTHALLSKPVQFARLALVITDEQHRFGVAQRATLSEKGENPHLLVMSATPIPRTLALMIYGDLEVSVLDELPPGRRPIATYAVGSDKRARAYGFVRRHLDEGRQAYVVCPLVEESETGGDLTAAAAYVETLRAEALRGYSVALLHGRMNAREKEAVMSAFARGEIQVLVSTTVIEVGVDVPNAVDMVIENAERFGLAQLHQLRGRVGRGQFDSTCILISDAQNETARRRLTVLCRTTDGFRIADEDLKLRGPGDFFGNRQHGLPQLKVADLLGDTALLTETRTAAAALLAADPLLTAPEHQPLATEVDRLFARVGEGGLS